MELGPPVYMLRGYDALTYAYNSRPLDDYQIMEARLGGSPIDLDLSIPCGCLNDCPYCGYRERLGNRITQRDIFRLIDEFAELGGHSIRIVGEGEPFLRQDLFEILARMHQNGLVPVVFTCGDVLGDDELSKKMHGKGSDELVQMLLELNATIMLKYDSLDNADGATGRAGYTKMRDRAFSMLLDAGFNRFNPTRLGFGVVITKRNILELPDIYGLALSNNIYFLGCYLMPIGRIAEDGKRDLVGPGSVELIEISASLYKIAYEYGVRELFDVLLCPPSEDFPLGFRVLFNGPHDFAGSRRCAIATSGFFVDCTGEIKFCETLPAVGRFPGLGLAEAWRKMMPVVDREYSACRSVGRCETKREVGVIPEDFDWEVKRKVQDHIDRNPERWGTRSIEPKLKAFFNKHPERLSPRKARRNAVRTR